MPLRGRARLKEMEMFCEELSDTGVIKKKGFSDAEEVLRGKKGNLNGSRHEPDKEDVCKRSKGRKDEAEMMKLYKKK